jgi:hypothetical protein
VPFSARTGATLTDLRDGQPLVQDLIRGVRKISRAAGLPEKTTYQLLQAGEMPGLELRGLWISTVPALQNWLAQLTARCDERASRSRG